MKLPIDIRNRLRTDFADNYNLAIGILDEKIIANDDLNHPRIIRCIVFLANKKIEGLRTVIEEAKTDKRDVMLWAEYEGLKDNEKLKRVRDFNKSFAECEKDIEE